MPITTDLDKFRLELGDHPSVDVPEGTYVYLLNDDEADYFLSKHPTNLLLAVADACDSLAARFSRLFDFATTSEKRFDLSQKTTHYLEIGKRLRARALLEGDGSGTATLSAVDGQTVRVLRATAAQVTTTFEYNDVPTIAVGDPSVAITRENGDPVRTATATTTAAAGRYVIQLTAADTAALDVLTLAWTATIGGSVQTITTYVEVRGARLFSIAQARQLRPLDNVTAFPTSRLVEARTLAEMALERACDVAFAPTYFRAALDGADRCDLTLPVVAPLTFTAATVDDDAIDAADLIPFASGRVYREDGWTAGHRNVVITGTHGHKVPPPEVSAACLEWARAYLTGDGSEPDPADLPKCAAVIERYGMTTSYPMA